VSTAQNILTSGADTCCDRKGHIFLRRSWRSVLPRVILGLLVSSLVYYAAQKFESDSLRHDFAVFGYDISWSLALAFLVLLAAIARPISLMFDCSHELGCHHMKSTKGLLSFQREHVEIPYEDILGVRVSQNIFERILNVGRILVWTASADRPEISMGGIGDPEAGAGQIKAKVDQILIQRSHLQKES